MARILVIDDEPLNGELLVRMLGYLGHHVLLASDGEAGFLLAREQRPDLIIADILMPGLDGYALVARLRADRDLASMRVMLYTALDLDSEVRQLAASAGILHILTKPAEPETILATVRDALEREPPAAPASTETLDQAYLRQLTGMLHEHVESLKAEIEARVQAEAALRAQTARLKILADASHAFARASQDYPATLDLVAHTMARALGDACMLYLLGSEGEALPLLAIADTSPLVCVQLRAGWEAQPFDAAHDPCAQRALAGRSPVLLVPGDHAPQCTLLGYLPGASLMLAPLHTEQRAIGLLCLLRHERAPYTADDIQLVQDLADRAALAIRNGQLVAELQGQLGQRLRAETEMRRLNRNLSDSQAQLASIIDSAMDAIITVDDTQRIAIWNAAAERMFGCSARDAHGQTLDRFIPVRLREAHRAHIQAFGRTGVTARAMGALRPLTALRADGTEFPIEASISCVAVGERQLFTVILRDISARVRAETALRSSEDRFATIFQLSPVAMVISALESRRILDVNNSFLRFAGYSRAEIVGMPAKRVELWADAVERERINGLLQAHGAVHNIEVRMRIATGQQRDVLLSIDSLQLDGQRCLISSLYDISERKRSELALQDTTQQMKDLSRRLVAIQEAERRNVARELHDEIGQMLTGLNLMLEAGGTFSHAALLARLHEAQTLVTDLTTRVRRLSLDLRPSMLDDLGLLPTLLWHFERYTAQTQVRVAFKHRGLDASLDPLIAVAVYRVVQEALTNVARHAQVGEAAVAVWTQGGLVVLSIEDRGVGFDFEAALAARRSNGMTSMRERVALLDGQLFVDTAVGQGTRILVELPLHRPERSDGDAQ